MGKKRVVDLAEELLEGFLRENMYELYSAEFVKEGADWHLRICIDRLGEAEGSPCDGSGIGTDDCEKVSRFLSDRLDGLDPIERSYFLEVSSPGLDRELSRDRDFARYSGRRVVLSLYSPHEGSKTLRGTLAGIENGEVSLEDASGAVLRLPRGQIAKAAIDAGRLF
ncbi:MAG: ribosome maturation factor RimP [Clostridiales Family XIII bacterium]|jgi:ribosome maturation factor RimP|nr:ribosome maturation factor RimP [Clostridiales Family XIII bacterium]